METATERLFSVYRMANEIVAGRVPMSNELAEELAALYAQVNLKYAGFILVSREVLYLYA